MRRRDGRGLHSLCPGARHRGHQGPSHGGRLASKHLQCRDHGLRRRVGGLHARVRSLPRRPIYLGARRPIHPASSVPFVISATKRKTGTHEARREFPHEPESPVSSSCEQDCPSAGRYGRRSQGYGGIHHALYQDDRRHHQGRRGRLRSGVRACRTCRRRGRHPHAIHRPARLRTPGGHPRHRTLRRGREQHPHRGVRATGRRGVPPTPTL